MDMKSVLIVGIKELLQVKHLEQGLAHKSPQKVLSILLSHLLSLIWGYFSTTHTHTHTHTHSLTMLFFSQLFQQATFFDFFTVFTHTVPSSWNVPPLLFEGPIHTHAMSLNKLPPP